MPTEVKELRVFVVAPPDVTDERGRIARALQSATSAVAERGVRFRSWHHAEDGVPGLYADGPGALVQEQLDEADLVVVVAWHKTGGPADDPGVALDAAVARWKQRGQPDVLVFLCQRAVPRAEMSREFFALEDALAKLEPIASIVKYAAPEDFEHRLREALIAHARKLVPATPSSPPAPARAPGADLDVAAHLDDVKMTCGSVDLTGLLVGDKASAAIPLRDVYVSLSAARGRRGDIEALRGPERAEPSDWDELLQPLRERDLDEAGWAEALTQGFTAAGVTVTHEDRATLFAKTKVRLQALEGDLDEAQARHIFETEPLEMVLRRHPHLLIEGDPGSGKTTTLRYVALGLVEAREGDTAAAQEMGFLSPYPLPVFVPLRELATHLLEHPQPGLPTAAPLVDYLVAQRGEWVRQTLADGAAVVLLDGLDEVVQDDLRTQTARVARAFVKTYGQNRFVMTSRPAGLTPEVRRIMHDGLEGLGDAKVEPLDLGEIRRFVRAWYRALKADPKEAETGANDLVDRIRRTDRVRELVQTPILLTAVAVVHINRGRLPERRAELYEECVKTLAGRWEEVAKKMALDGLDLDERVAFFARLAFETHEAGKDGQDIERATLYAHTKDALADKAGASPKESVACEIAERLVDRTGLLRAAKQAHYRFRHLTFQEFLAARWLSSHHPDPDPVLRRALADPWWREVVQLLLGFEAKDGPNASMKRLDTLMHHLEGVDDRETQARGAATLARALLDLRLYPSGARFEEAAARLTPLWVRLIEDANQPGSVADRVAMGDALGVYGDPRLSEDRRWVHISAGRFWRGLSPATKEAASHDSTPAGWVTLTEPFHLQRWATTVGEFAEFIEAGGYGEEGLWDPEGWAWRQRGAVTTPGGWFEELPSNQPVVAVSWYEAEAYARWLNRERALPGFRIHLPTGAQSQRGARPAEGESGAQRVYPWGDDWDPACAMCEDHQLSCPAAVGLFPRGHSVSGVWDSAGNVWEWCADGTSQDYPEAEETDPVHVQHGVRVVRGGAWYGRSENLRVSYRYWFRLVNRYDYLGFRVCASPVRP